MIFIGLDVSKISTALCIEKNNKTKLFSYTTKKSNNCWIKDTNDFINYRHIEYKYLSEKDYSKSELIKLVEFDETTNLIINDIFNNVKILDSLKIGIEGYAYQAKGDIFDLIEFTTLLKHKLIHKLNGYSSLMILSPHTLKSETCKMIYKPRIETKGKRVIKYIQHFENNKGKEATKWDKKDMFQAFIDSNLKLELKEWSEKYSKEILKNKDLPKPIDDVCDAIFLKEIIKKQDYQK